MSSKQNWTNRIRTAGRILSERTRHHMQMSMCMGRSLAHPLLAVVLVFVVLSAPVAAQENGNGGGDGSESGIVETAVCNSPVGTLFSALFSLLVLGLSGFGVFYGGNGLRKMGDPRSGVKQEGREEAKGGVISLIGALLVLTSPQLLSQLGLNFATCVSIGGI